MAHYDVGYGKPPKEYQWQPGQSGNPSGGSKKPKAPAKPLAAELAAELNVLVPMTIDGKTVQVTQAQAIVKMLVRQTIKATGREKMLIIEKLAKMGVLSLQELLIEEENADPIIEPTDEERQLLEFFRSEFESEIEETAPPSAHEADIEEQPEATDGTDGSDNMEESDKPEHGKDNDPPDDPDEPIIEF